MQLELTICAASEALDLIKAHEKDRRPFALVISIEGVGEGIESKAPRLTNLVGPEWTGRQIILTCSDIEAGVGAPEREIVRTALDHFEKHRTATDLMRVLVHCRRGKSRSTALGLVILRHHHGPGTEKECREELLRIRPRAAPNIAIVQHGDALLGCEGALVRVVESDPEMTRRRAEATVARTPFATLVSWHLGKADTARRQILESMSAARSLKKAESIASPLTYACMLYRELHEPDKVEEVAEQLLALARENRFSGSSAFGCVFLGWAWAEQEREAEGIALIRDGLDLIVRTGGGVTALAVLSDAQASSGRIGEAFATIEQSLIYAQKSAIELQSVIWRRGELYLRRHDQINAERDFHATLATARRIGSKAYELRAATSLAKLLLKRNKADEARAMLTAVYDTFTEGFATNDLVDAKMLLQQLG